MNFNKYHVSKNLFDKTAKSINNGFIANARLASTGATTSTEDYNISEYIEIEANTDYAIDLGSTSVNQYAAVCFYNSSKDYVSGERYSYNQSISITTPANAKYLRFSVLNQYENITMLNTGSTALPYEPYGNTWNSIPHYIHNTSTDTLTTLPAVLYPNDTTATVGLKGNTVQTGTPTPDNPIMPQCTGENTGNLYFKSLANCSIDAIGTLIGNSQFICYVAKVEANKTYIGEKGYVYAFFDTEPVLGSYSYNRQRMTENARAGITSPINGYVVVRFNTGTTDAMLSEGTTILPYEPYGIKIPILSTGQTTPVYLGEVETTRRVKKLVLTGEESWIYEEAYSRFWINVADFTTLGLRLTPFVSNVFGSVSDGRPIADVPDNTIYSGSWGSVDTHKFYIKCTTYTSAADFKSYLAAQYAAGTPVTVWYVLATEKTAVVNEPLMKIGDYADEVSGITVPTITGADSFDVETTLKPSEVSLSYTGWHDVTVQEWDGSQWNE